MNRLGVSLLVTAAWLGPAVAEPGPNVSKLMNEPVSLFSFGLYRLGETVFNLFDSRYPRPLAAPLSGEQAYSTSVSYDWDANRILIRMMQFEERPAGWDLEEECQQVFSTARSAAFINIETGEPRAESGASWFADHFTPIGYGTKDLPDDITVQIDQIIELIFQVGVERPFICRAPLVGTGYAIQR
jgi:hypothetical protein